jgi:DNA-binding transcriptional regulator LsrR (DeoR family)
VDEISRSQLLAEIASLYYVDKVTQKEIGSEFGYSRSGISRLLDEAEKRGIVKITINFPIQRDFLLEKKIVDTYQLQEAYVLKNDRGSYDQPLDLVGRLGAIFLEHRLKNGLVIGISWGTSIYSVVDHLPELDLRDVTIVQVVGAIGGKSDPRIDGPEIVSFFAKKLNATYLSLNSPQFLDSKEACTSFLSQRQISDTLNIAYQADFILTGIGTIDTDRKFSSLFRSGVISEQEVVEIKKRGGICNLCGRILDENGNYLDIDINHRAMAIDLKKLSNKNRKIVGIAAGKEKTDAVKAALKSGLVDVLIADQAAIDPIFNSFNEREIWN